MKIPVKNLEFKFEPSPGSNDDQVQVILDGLNIADLDGGIGLDPPEFFAQTSLREGGHLFVGRCECGVIGCGDLVVEVVVAKGQVEWIGGGKTFVFNYDEYISKINAAAEDYSWEDCGRTAERLVSRYLQGTVLREGCEFHWASTRISRGQVTLSFDGLAGQTLVSIGWDGVDPQTALNSAKAFKFERHL